MNKKKEFTTRQLLKAKLAGYIQDTQKVSKKEKQFIQNYLTSCACIKSALREGFIKTIAQIAREMSIPQSALVQKIQRKVLPGPDIIIAGHEYYSCYLTETIKHYYSYVFALMIERRIEKYTPYSAASVEKMFRCHEFERPRSPVELTKLCKILNEKAKKSKRLMNKATEKERLKIKLL